MSEVVDRVLCVQSAIASDLCGDALTCAGAALRRTAQIVCEFTLIPTYCCGRGFTCYSVLIVRVNECVGFYDVTNCSEECNDLDHMFLTFYGLSPPLQEKKVNRPLLRYNTKINI